MQWQFRILELFDVMLFPFEFPDGFRAAAEFRGFRFGRGRQPQTSAQRSDRSAFATACKASWRIFDWWSGPLPVARRLTGGPKEQVEQVVSEVMSELEKRGVF